MSFKRIGGDDVDREKVVIALELCARREPGEYDCCKCPYETRIDGDGCEVNVMLDAVDLLKEQEAVVRCNECKNFDEYNVECRKEHNPNPPYNSWFCADGERKEEKGGKKQCGVNG